MGVSGGIDSAVTSTLCAMTGAPRLAWRCPFIKLQTRPTAPRITSRPFAPSSTCPAFDGVADRSVRHLFSGIARWPRREQGLAMANSRARLRIPPLRIGSTFACPCEHREQGGGLRRGFYTKYGDGGVDLSPIADLTKTEVFALAAHLGVIDAIQQAAPTDGLWGDDRTDEDQLGATYPELEWHVAWGRPCRDGQPGTQPKGRGLVVAPKGKCSPFTASTTGRTSTKCFRSPCVTSRRMSAAAGSERAQSADVSVRRYWWPRVALRPLGAR